MLIFRTFFIIRQFSKSRPLPPPCLHKTKNEHYLFCTHPWRRLFAKCFETYLHFLFRKFWLIILWGILAEQNGLYFVVSRRFWDPPPSPFVLNSSTKWAISLIFFLYFLQKHSLFLIFLIPHPRKPTIARRNNMSFFFSRFLYLHIKRISFSPPQSLYWDIQTQILLEYSITNRPNLWFLAYNKNV